MRIEVMAVNDDGTELTKYVREIPQEEEEPGVARSAVEALAAMVKAWEDAEWDDDIEIVVT